MKSVKNISFWIRIKLFIACTFCAMQGCVPEPLDVKNLDMAEQKIVVASTVLRDTTIAVLLTRTASALEGKEEDLQAFMDKIAINDAKVTITTGDSTYELKLMRDGIYRNPLIPVIAGNRYDLYVSSKKYGVVTASTQVELPVSFDTVRAEIYSYSPENRVAQVTYGIHDPAAPNYYMINVYNSQKQHMMENVINPQSYTRLVDDIAFNGSFFSEQFRAIPHHFSEGDSIAVSISNVTPDYYHYLKVRSSNQFGIIELFSEPVTYPTNIHGGRGYFTLQIPDIRIMIL